MLTPYEPIQTIPIGTIKGHTCIHLLLYVVASLLVALISQLTTASITHAAPAPTITSLSPTTGPTSGGTSVTITGTNFLRAKDFSDLSAGGEHTCAVAGKKAYCWGSNASGQLGTGNKTNSTTPVAVQTSGVLSGKTITAITASSNHTCAIADGQVYCWGSNTDGKLGNGSAAPESTTPVAVGGPLSGKTVTKISTSPGSDHTCAVADGAAYCWGTNMWRQLGIGEGDYDPHPTPLAVTSTGALSGKTVTDISAGIGHTCAIASGAAYCWGFNDTGSLGDGTYDPSGTPVAVQTSGVLNGKVIEKISAHVTSCAVADKRAYCWGNNVNGRLGDGTQTDRIAPVAVLTSGVLNNKEVTDISARGLHTCALADGLPYCWGANTHGGLGNGTTTTSLVPVASNTSVPMQRLSSGESHTCTSSVEAIYCWGFNNAGQVGNGTTATPQTTPTTTNTSALPFASAPHVAFGSTPSTNVTFTSATQLTALAPAHSAGIVNVTVTNPDQQSAVRSNGYTYQAPVTAPSAPRSLIALPVENGVRLTWDAPSSDGGAPITDYRIEYSSNDGSSWQTYSRPASTSRDVTVPNLTTSTTYSFRVSAINSAGTSPSSATAAAQTRYITINAAAAVTINLTPTAQSRTSSTSHQVSVSTNADTGYSLTLSMLDTQTSLRSGTHSVAATSGSFAAPAALGLNTWGYRVPGAGGFGAGGGIETNVASSNYTWAGVPGSNTPIMINSTATAVQNSLTTIWYAMRADTQKASGSYSGTVVYTAITN